LEVTRIFQANQRTRNKIAINRGGTRSGKTWALCQLAAHWLISGRISPGDTPEIDGVWSIIRATLPALKATAYRDFIHIINETRAPVLWSRTEFTFTYGGRVVEFFALDDPQKVRSRKRKYLHVVEANEIGFDSFIQLLIRTSVRVFLDFNPDIPDVWIRTELEQKRAAELGDVDVIVSTYKDNRYLTADEIREIEYLQRVDPDLWRVFGTGEYGQTVGTVFRQPVIVPAFPTDLEIVYGGIDWGFSFDPTAAVRVGLSGENLFIDELLFERGLVNSEIFERLPPGLLYVADSAEPKSIEDLRRMGLRIIPSVKGPDSIRSGVNRMREFTIHVTGRSSNVLKEFRNYKFGPDNEPIDAFNHAIDAVRYVVQTKMKRNNDTGTGYIVNGFDSAAGSRGGRGRMV
jgi:phage terminase large subunit